MFLLGAHDVLKFRVAMDGVLALCKVLEGEFRRDKGPTARPTQEQSTVRDPDIAKTKGAPKKPKEARRRGRLCSRCKLSGHTKRKCPSKKRKACLEVPAQGEGGEMKRSGEFEEIPLAEKFKGPDKRMRFDDSYDFHPSFSSTCDVNGARVGLVSVEDWHEEVIGLIRRLENHGKP